MYFVAQELREIMANLGFRSIDEMIGKSQKLSMKTGIDDYKLKGIDLSKILYRPSIERNIPIKNIEKQDHKLKNVLDFKILKSTKLSIDKKIKISLDFDIKNTDRAVGAIISNEISKIYGEKALPKNIINLNFNGSAGQSFGAFAVKGLKMTVNGNTNDYFGKGLSGGTLIVRVPKKATFEANKNIITGNVALYGGTSGEAYINGIAGERFCVRNSGVKAVVEGIGDHGCEYMTGGIVVILGSMGRNFAAGMSGGTAYIYKDSSFDQRNFNMNMIEFETMETFDFEILKNLIENHYSNTNSKVAEDIIKKWNKRKNMFIKIMPTEYKAALDRISKEKISQLLN